MKAKPFRLWRIDGKFTEEKGEKRKQKEKLRKDTAEIEKRINKGFAKEIFTMLPFLLLSYNTNYIYITL